MAITDDEITVTPLTKVSTNFVLGVAGGRRVVPNAITPRYVVVYPGMDRWISVAGESDRRAHYVATRIANVRAGARVIKVVE